MNTLKTLNFTLKSKRVNCVICKLDLNIAAIKKPSGTSDKTDNSFMTEALNFIMY